MTYLIADSGSTKTSWAYIDSVGRANWMNSTSGASKPSEKQSMEVNTLILPPR